MIFIKTKTPTDHPDGVLVTKSEVSRVLWDTERDQALQAVRDSVTWYLEQEHAQGTGPTKYLVTETDPDLPFAPPVEIERGTL